MCGPKKKKRSIDASQSTTEWSGRHMRLERVVAARLPQDGGIPLVCVCLCVNRMGVWLILINHPMIHSWVRSRCLNQTPKWGHDYNPQKKKENTLISHISVSDSCSILVSFGDSQTAPKTNDNCVRRSRFSQWMHITGSIHIFHHQKARRMFPETPPSHLFI